MNITAEVYEDPQWMHGTGNSMRAVAKTDGYTVIGGGAMIRFLSGREPRISAMEKAYTRDRKVHPVNAPRQFFVNG